MIDNKYDSKVLLTIEVAPGACHWAKSVTTVTKVKQTTKSGKEFWTKQKSTGRPLEFGKAQLKLKITNVAYEWMTSDNPPEWFMPWAKSRRRDWKKFDVEAKLKTHFDRIASSYGSTNYSYSIIYD